MLETIISGLLDRVSNDIKSGNCNLSEIEIIQIVDCLKEMTSPFVSKYKACEYLGISRAKFDAMVKEGILPKGKKTAGLKELLWNKNELDKAIDKINKNGNNR